MSGPVAVRRLSPRLLSAALPLHKRGKGASDRPRLGVRLGEGSARLLLPSAVCRLPFKGSVQGSSAGNVQRLSVAEGSVCRSLPVQPSAACCPSVCRLGLFVWSVRLVCRPAVVCSNHMGPFAAGTSVVRPGQGWARLSGLSVQLAGTRSAAVHKGCPCQGCPLAVRCCPLYRWPRLSAVRWAAVRCSSARPAVRCPPLRPSAVRCPLSAVRCPLSAVRRPGRSAAVRAAGRSAPPPPLVRANQKKRSTVR